MEVAATEELSLKKNLLWNSAGNLVYLISQWLFTYVVTNALGFEQAGVYSLAVSISSSFYMISSYAMRSYQVSDVKHQYHDSTYIASRWLTSTVAIAACLVFAAANGYPMQTFICIALYMLFKITESLSDVYQGVMQLRMRMDYIGKSFMIKGVLELIVFFIALVLTRSLEISLTVLFVGAVSITHFYDAKKARLFYAPIKPRLASVIQLLRECLPAAIYGLLFTFAGQLPKYFIENQLGTEALGYYSSIAMPVLIIQVSASFIFSPLATPLAESLERHDRDNFIKLIAKVLIAIAALAIAGLSGFFLLGSPFYQMLFSERILPYVYLATPLALCSVLVALSWFLATVLTVMRRLNHLMLFSLVTFLIVLISCIPSIQALGMNGATITYIIALTIFNTLCLLVLSKELKQRSEPNTKKTLEK